MIDAHGNLLFCNSCIVACLDVHCSRIRKQRIIKQKQKQEPILEMTKKEVTEKKLVDYVLNGDDELLTFQAWWKTLDDDEVVEVQYPHERHGLAARTSNHAKLECLEDFLQFADNNSQPNGRHAGSYKAHSFFIPKFTRIAGPREGEKNYSEKVNQNIA